MRILCEKDILDVDEFPQLAIEDIAAARDEPPDGQGSGA